MLAFGYVCLDRLNMVLAGEHCVPVFRDFG
jgi:hypothetical protein